MVGFGIVSMRRISQELRGHLGPRSTVEGPLRGG